MKKYFLLSLYLVLGTSYSFSQTITPEIISDIRNVSEVAISPSGKDIAYILRVPGEDASGMQKGVLMIVPKAGGSSKTILEKKYNPSSISWSTDGKKIFYIAKDTVSKTNQLYSAEFAETVNIKKITSAENSVSHYAFSPDGQSLALIYTDAQNDQEKADEKKKKDWEIKDDNLKYDRLYVTDAEASAKPKEISDKVLNVTSFIWSPDGKTIFFEASDKTSIDWTYMYQKIYKVNAEGGTPQVVCETEGKLGNLSVSPDGKNLAFCGAVDISDPLPQSVFVVPDSGGEAKNFTPNYEGSVVEVKWISNTSLLALTVEGCYSALKKIDLKGKMTSVYGKGAIIRAMSLNVKTGVMAFSASTPQNPYEVYSGSTSGGLKKLTDSNPDLKGIKLTKQEVVSWNGADGWKIEGILTYPKDYKAGTKYPLLLQIHGGPEGVSANGWNTRSVYPVQWYAANGYFVLEPNYRGSQGRGVNFAKGDHKDMGGKEMDDVLAGIDFLVAKGMVDNDKIGTGGFSYGGYLSAWASTKHSARFKASVMGAGISNWISFSGTTEIIHENSLVHWDLWWNDNMELVWDRSPLAHINDAKTPMLIVHGGADTRVPITQSEEMYNALKLKKVHTQMIVYKRQPHGILEREAQIDFMNRTLEWFKDHIK
ncbi:MAG: S9 family peptidase [Bacteroidetes bacterium]|nr:S9 family peptidase [Bacteroidota bacterium]